MAQPVLRNVIIAITGSDDSQVIANLTVSDPGGRRLADHIAGVAHLTDPAAIRNALKIGFAQVDWVIANQPAPVPDAPADGRPLIQVYADDLVDVAEGRKVVLLHEGLPVIVDATEAANADLGDGSASGEKHREETWPGRAAEAARLGIEDNPSGT